MIAVRLEGRLGNQLFQYAFIYTTAKRLNTGFYIDKSIEDFIPAKYFELQNDFLHPIDNSIFSIKEFKDIFKIRLKKSFYKLLSKIIFKNKIKTIGNNEPISEVLKNLENNCLYKGFFYSASYFADFKDAIKKEYQLKDSYINAFKKIQDQLPPSKKKVVVHIRRSDYVDLGLVLPVSYYKKAIESIRSIDLTYIFISDDPAFIEEEFDYIPDKYISTYNEIIDLQFLINADICILSNSSFSWWGAWLNTNKNKQLLAPKYWLGFKEQKEYPTGIADDMNFNWIEV